MNIQQTKQRYGIIGNCREINQAVEIALQVAPTEVTVLIYGENGTGKDVFSRIIHDNSKRKHKKFIAINTGAIPEGTLDSELFGHEKGAFTSAYESRKGYFEEVEGGTIFLDEIGEMPLATQARLLRLLENGEYLRVGSSKVRKADVRVIAATNKNLVEMIRQGKFREDLYFRLNTVSIHVPPLRNRGKDIELLFNYFAWEFAEKYKREPIELHPDAVDLLYKYRWPGNVRELKNLVEKLTVLVREEQVMPNVLEENLLIKDSYLPSIVHVPAPNGDYDNEPQVSRHEFEMQNKLLFDLAKEVAELKKMVYMAIQGGKINVPAFSNPTADYGHYNNEQEISAGIQPQSAKKPLLVEESLSLARKEKEMIEKALRKHHNNRKKAAMDLGISERTLYRKIKNYDIDM
ncbi:MAG: sigma-54-dependent Fis family transcriptional regulator [Bacteroidetes bacterium]|nr:MAG: sigma-54-dependent Fis family transcriptional regulator [Bacteroidota bacterium]